MPSNNEKTHVINPSADETPRHLTKQEFARRLYSRMTAKQMIQSDLARITGLSRNNISTYIRGANYPSRRSLELLAGALGCPVDALLPNYHEQAILDEQQPDMALKVSTADPKRAWLTVNRMVSTSIAVKIVAMLADDEPQTTDGRQ